jgi:hypothetical protein
MRARLLFAFAVLAVGLAAVTIAETASKPSYVPASNPPSSLHAYACSAPSDTVQQWIPLCAAK